MMEVLIKATVCDSDLPNRMITLKIGGDNYEGRLPLLLKVPEAFYADILDMSLPDRQSYINKLQDCGIQQIKMEQEVDRLKAENASLNEAFGISREWARLNEESKRKQERPFQNWAYSYLAKKSGVAVGDQSERSYEESCVASVKAIDDAIEVERQAAVNQRAMRTLMKHGKIDLSGAAALTIDKKHLVHGDCPACKVLADEMANIEMLQKAIDSGKLKLTPIAAKESKPPETWRDRPSML